MKKLFLIRHAKSNQSILNIPDIDRPLNERGYADAHTMGKLMKNENDRGLLLVSSPAVRALSTALIFAGEINYDKETIKITNRLYEAEIETCLDVIRNLDDTFTSAMLFGHNPTTAEVIYSLYENFQAAVPTCAIAIFTFQMEKWADIKPTNAYFEKLLIPADFREKSI